MDAEKYSRSVSLHCPTCGSDQFEFEGDGDTAESVKCASCGRAFTRDALIEENSENISEHVREIGTKVTKDFAKEMRDTLKRAFRGSKHIKIR